MTTKKIKSSKEMIKKVGIGMAISGLAAATAAVGYFLYGPKGEKNRKKIKGWMLKMKGEVLQKMESLKEVGKESYEDLVEEIGNKYKKIKNVNVEDVEALVKKLKADWSKIEKDNIVRKKILKKK